MSPDELRIEIEAGRIDTVVLAFPDHYGRLMGKRYDAQFFLDSAFADGGHACDYLFTVDMEMNPVEGYAYASWERGYGDFHMVPDPAGVRPCGWTDGAAVVMCDAHDNSTHLPVDIAPRSILRRVTDAAAAQGFVAKGASELEFFIYRDSYRAAKRSGFVQRLCPSAASAAAALVGLHGLVGPQVSHQGRRVPSPSRRKRAHRRSTKRPISGQCRKKPTRTTTPIAGMSEECAAHSSGKRSGQTQQSIPGRPQWPPATI